MAISIHYQFAFSGSETAAREFVSRLHEAAISLNTGEVAAIKDFAGDDAKYPSSILDEDATLKLAAVSWLTVGEVSHPVAASSFTGFEWFPGEGCEPVPMGLAQFPATITINGQEVNTELGEGWHWICHVKTQYASNPEFGGIQNFLQCHLSICALLEKAREFGAAIYVVDDSDFWEHRNVRKLVHAVEQFNEVMAGLIGTMKDANAEGSIQSPIVEYPNFEHLEANAMAKPDLAESLRGVAREMKRDLL